jgi:hypothetical protein
MRSGRGKALLFIAALAVVMVLVWLLWFRPSRDVTSELQEVFSTTNSTPSQTSAPSAEASNAVRHSASATRIRYDAQPTGSKAKIAGTSSVHDWTMECLVLGGFIEADAQFPESALNDPNAAKPRVEAFLPVRAFKSYSKRMDEVMQEQMDEPKHKRIEYKLIELKPKSPPGSMGTLQFEAIGSLTVKGTTRTNTMPVTIEKQDGKLKVSGSTPLKMTDFGVQPPKITIPLIGTITTGDEIQVSLEWQTAAKVP